MKVTIHIETVSPRGSFHMPVPPQKRAILKDELGVEVYRGALHETRDQAKFYARKYAAKNGWTVVWPVA